MTTHSSITQLVRSLLTTGLVAMLVACGGSGSSSDDDTLGGSVPIATRGLITQLGSIHVNGVKYETPNGNSYSNDDSTSTVANYQVGQVVSLRGRRNDDGVTGTATEVQYEAEIEGAALGGAINGVTILITDNTNTLAATLNSGALFDGNRYEVSGTWLGDTIIDATFIKDDDDTDLEDEIKGDVETSTATTITVRGVTYTYDGVPAVSAGDLVEIHFDPITLTAPAGGVEFEDDFFDQAEGMEVEIEGAVDRSTAGCPAEAEFKIDGVCIDSDSKPAQWMDGLTAFADLAQGSRAEAEGHMVSGSPVDYLRADKVKGRGNRVRVSSFATIKLGDATSGSFQLIEGNIDVQVLGGVTEYDGVNFAGIDVANPNQRLEVRGVRTASGSNSMLAIRVKLEDASDGKPDEHELRAQIDDGGASTSNVITVMQLTSSADSGTELELDDEMTFVGSLSQFLDMIDDNGDVSDGPNDVVEVRIDSSGTGFYAEQIEIEEEDD